MEEIIKQLEELIARNKAKPNFSQESWYVDQAYQLALKKAIQIVKQQQQPDTTPSEIHIHIHLS